MVVESNRVRAGKACSMKSPEGSQVSVLKSRERLEPKNRITYRYPSSGITQAINIVCKAPSHQIP